MIRALLIRRIWLWKNRMLSGLILLFAFPLFIFAMINLSFRKILIRSISDIPFDEWVYPGMVFFVAAFSVFPIIYRDFFDLRIHRKVLVNIALSPYSKLTMISSYLCVSTLEALVLGITAMAVYAFIIPFPFTMIQLISMVFYLILFTVILGNILITLSVTVSSPTTYIMLAFIIFFLVIFGSGLIIEFGFFPMTFEKVLIWLPLSIPVRALRFILVTGMIEWTLTISSIAFCTLWSLCNGMLLREKLRQ